MADPHFSGLLNEQNASLAAETDFDAITEPLWSYQLGAVVGGAAAALSDMAGSEEAGFMFLRLLSLGVDYAQAEALVRQVHGFVRDGGVRSIDPVAVKAAFMEKTILRQRQRYYTGTGADNAVMDDRISARKLWIFLGLLFAGQVSAVFAGVYWFVPVVISAVAIALINQMFAGGIRLNNGADFKRMELVFASASRDLTDEQIKSAAPAFGELEEEYLKDVMALWMSEGKIEKVRRLFALSDWEPMKRSAVHLGMLGDMDYFARFTENVPYSDDFATKAVMIDAFLDVAFDEDTRAELYASDDFFVIASGTAHATEEFLSSVRRLLDRLAGSPISSLMPLGKTLPAAFVGVGSVVELESNLSAVEQEIRLQGAAAQFDRFDNTQAVPLLVAVCELAGLPVRSQPGIS